MRAIVHEGAGGRDVVRVADRPDPEVGPDDALVAVAFAGLNRADVLHREGRYPGVPAAASPGLEFSGTVRAVGARVRTLAPGDRVCGLVPDGAHAELVATPALALARVPAELSLRTAAAVPESFLTAYDALVTRGGFAFGETVVIHAVGSGVGLAALELVRAGGGVAIGTSRTPAKLERARERGLRLGLALDDAWPAAARDATGGAGVDLVLDFVGAPTLGANVAAVATGGRIVQIGTLGGATATLALGAFMAKRVAYHGTVMRSRPLDERIALARTLERRLLPQVAAGSLRAEIDATFALADVRAAHARMESDESFGRIVLEVAGEG